MYGSMAGMEKAPTEQKTTLRLDRALHRRLRVLAAQRETTFSKCLHEAVERYLKTEEPKAGRRT
jgi:predicted transcriptional regulator